MSYSSIRQVMLTRAARDEIENQRQAKRDKQKRERRVQDGETPERPPLIRTCLCLINATDTAAAAFVPVIAVNADPLLLILTKRAPRRFRGGWSVDNCLVDGLDVGAGGDVFKVWSWARPKCSGSSGPWGHWRRISNSAKCLWDERWTERGKIKGESGNCGPSGLAGRCLDAHGGTGRFEPLAFVPSNGGGPIASSCTKSSHSTTDAQMFSSIWGAKRSKN